MSPEEPVESRFDRRRRRPAAPPQTACAALVDATRIARWPLTLHGPDGRDGPNERRFNLLEPDRVEKIEHLDSDHFFLTLTQGPEGAGTRVHWWQRFETAAQGHGIADFVAQATTGNLDRLDAEVLQQVTP